MNSTVEQLIDFLRLHDGINDKAKLAMLAVAPQPEPLSPWLPIDDFLSSEIFGVVWVKTKDDIRLCNHKVLGMFVGVLTGALFTKREVTHVILLERPQAPEVE